jgi:hypothetical protein
MRFKGCSSTKDMHLLLSLHITCSSSSGRAYGTNLAEATRMILPTRVYYILGTMPICTVPTENRRGVPQALRRMRAKIGPEKGSLPTDTSSRRLIWITVRSSLRSLGNRRSPATDVQYALQMAVPHGQTFRASRTSRALG